MSLSHPQESGRHTHNPVDTTKCVPTRPEKNWPSIVPLAIDFAREPGTSSTKQPWILKVFSNSCHPLFMSEHLSHPHHDCSWCPRSAKLQRWRINGLNLNDGLRTIRIERGTILFNAWAGRLKHGFGVCWEAIFLTGHSHSVATATHDSLTLLRSRKIGQSICAVHRYFTSSDVSSLRFPRFTVYNSPWLVSTSHLRNLGSWIKLPSHGDGTYTVIIKWYMHI